MKGSKWAKAHHFDNKGELPARVKKKATQATARRKKVAKKGRGK